MKNAISKTASVVLTPDSSKPLRCAVYARVSVEKAAQDEPFTSIQAQVLACKSFIADQRMPHWIAIEPSYEDSGFSGGSLNRPALQALISDMAAKKVDVVVIHKLDRLSRSMVDMVSIASQQRVHEVLAKDSHSRSVETKIRSRTDALLRGLLYAPSGERMYPTYSRKNGRKYHYYVSKSESRFGAPGKTYERLPAPEIEAAVIGQIRSVLTSPESIASVVRFIQRNGAQIDEATTVMAMGRLNDVWEQLFPAERHRIANLMIERVDLVHTGDLARARHHRALDDGQAATPNEPDLVPAKSGSSGLGGATPDRATL